MLDTIIAVTIVIILITASYYYIARSEEDIMPNLQLVRTGSDIITSLDNQDLLGPSEYQLEDNEEETLKKIIKNEIKKILPANYEINITIEHKCECDKDIPASLCNSIERCLCEGTYSIGDKTPNDRFIAAGKRFFTTKIKAIDLEETETEGCDFEDLIEDFENVLTDQGILYYGSIKYQIWLK